MRELREFLRRTEEFSQENGNHPPVYVPEGWRSNFEEQRSHIGLCYALSNAIRNGSKVGIAALKRDDTETLDQAIKMAQEAWDRLGEVNIPQDLRWQFDAEAGQELVELELALPFSFVLNGEDPASLRLPSAEDIKVSPQTWLAGFGDAITEVGKIYLERLCEDGMSRADRLTLRRRNLALAKMGRDVLGQFETVYPKVINNNRRRGYFNTYRGLIQRIDGVIGREMEAIAAILDRDAK